MHACRSTLEDPTDLLTAFAAAPGNIVFSPSSIGTAMAMALSGARGATETEMIAALRHTQARADVAAANAAWARSSGASSTPSLKLVSANALMLVRPATVSPAYTAMLRADYAAEIVEHATADRVNAWVSRKTEGKIERIVDRLDPDLTAVIVNATYFKAAWAAPFDPRATRPRDFHLSATATAPVTTMHAQGRYAAVDGEGYRALRLPYSGDTLAMIVILPDEAVGVDAIGARLDAGAVSSLAARLQAMPADTISIALPRFKTGFAARLGGAFARLGMKTVFDPARADFSGITGRPPREAPMAISEVMHRAVIDVTEEGTEAAAATALTPRTTAMRPVPQPFIVDRPFLFFIVEGASGAVLFEGRIVDPRAAEGR